MNKKTIGTLAIFFIVFFPMHLHAAAAIGLCENDGGNIRVAITTNDNGQLLDLAVTVDETHLTRFPEANDTSVDLAMYRYRFSVGKKAHHDALYLDINGTKGRIKFQGKKEELECNWE